MKKKASYNKENLIEISDFNKHVRKRPGMYIGASGEKGMIILLIGLIQDCISICKTTELVANISLREDKLISFQLISKHDISGFGKTLDQKVKGLDHINLRILKAISDSFELINNSKNMCSFKFDVSPSFVDIKSLDYQFLNQELLEFSILNRNIHILLLDSRGIHQNQNYYHFPEGIAYWYNRKCNDVLGTPEFKITYDDFYNNLEFQIILAYRADWYPQPNVLSYSNDLLNSCGGSLNEGVLDGFIIGCRRFVKENNLTQFKIKKKKFFNGLILICSVRGRKFRYAGSFNERLDDEPVKKKVKKLMTEKTMKYMTENKEKTMNFLWRFDDTQLMSRIM